MSVGNERALEVAHTALVATEASLEREQGIGQQSVDTGRDIGTMARGIMESGDAEALIDGHPEGPLIVGISSDGEYRMRGFLEFPNEGGKFVFAENGIDGGKDETAAREHGTEYGKAVHAAGGARRNEAKRHAAQYALI